MRKRKWVLLLAVLVLVGWGGLSWWNEQVPIKVKQISWVAPEKLDWLEAVVDLDNDGNEEIIASSSDSERVWWLRIEGDKWLAERLPWNTEMWHPLRGELKSALPVFRHEQLWLLRKRGKWVEQKIAENVKDSVITDLDGDNRKDDLVLLEHNSKRCQVVWFEIDSDGFAHFREAVSYRSITIAESSHP